MKLTKSEEWIISARTFGFSGAHHSCWASPICLRLVEKGLLLRNKKGRYKLNEI